MLCCRAVIRIIKDTSLDLELVEECSFDQILTISHLIQRQGFFDEAMRSAIMGSTVLGDKKARKQINKETEDLADEYLALTGKYVIDSVYSKSEAEEIERNSSLVRKLFGA